MRKTALTGRTRRASAWLLAPFVAVLIILLPAGPAFAHPLDITWQTSYVTVAAGQVTVEVKESVGVLVAPSFIAALDTDGDKAFTPAEGAAYARRMLAELTLTIDGAPVALSAPTVVLPDYAQTKAGYGVLRVTATGAAPTAAGDHALAYANDFAAEKPQYEVAVFTAKNAAIRVGRQDRTDDQRRVRTVYTLGGVPAPAAAAAPAEDGSGVQRLLTMVRDPRRTLWITILAVGLAMALGAFHALTPGHGKTMMAAYLVGSGGRVRDAVALGVSVTATHTASVLIIGVVALLASHFAIPHALVPALELVSGGLVLVLGLRLLWQRRHALPWMPHGHSHTHGGHDHHDHDHGHDHGHGHGHRGPIRLGSVVALGISGGLVPCPEALGVMILAVGLGRVAVGMLLIVSFSVGLAAVLVGIGILLVRARPLARRLGGRASGRLAGLLPVVSALVVIALGTGLLIRTTAALTG